MALTHCNSKVCRPTSVSGIFRRNLLACRLPRLQGRGSSHNTSRGSNHLFSGIREECGNDEPGFWRHDLGVGDILELHASDSRGSVVASQIMVSSIEDDFDLYSRRKSRRYERDAFKENSRKLFRTVFDFENWAEHRATSRYMRHISGIFKSRLVYGLATPLISVSILAVLVAVGHELLNYGVFVIPEGLKDVLFINSAIPMSLTSSILGLLLVFRTNSSYSRWLDARKNWGVLVNRSRDIVRQGMTWLPEDEQGDEYAGMLCRWVVALSYCLKCHLRENEDPVEKLRQLKMLHEDELEALNRVRHKPAYAMQMLSVLARRLTEINPKSTIVFQCMESNITQLEDVCGSCERILRTPIPLSYTRHTSRFMIVWLSLLPFALWETCGWGMVPLTVAISLLTLGVEEIGVIIEEPFSVLPLERICATIASDVKEIRLHGSSARAYDYSGVSQQKEMLHKEKLLVPSKGIIPVSLLMDRLNE